MTELVFCSEGQKLASMIGKPGELALTKKDFIFFIAKNLLWEEAIELFQVTSSSQNQEQSGGELEIFELSDSEVIEVKEGQEKSAQSSSQKNNLERLTNKDPYMEQLAPF